MRWTVTFVAPDDAAEGFSFTTEVEGDSAIEARRRGAALAIKAHPTAFTSPAREVDPVERLALAGLESHVERVAQWTTATEEG